MNEFDGLKLFSKSGIKLNNNNVIKRMWIEDVNIFLKEMCETGVV